MPRDLGCFLYGQRGILFYFYFKMHQIANYDIFILNGHTDLLHRIVLIRFYSYASGGFDFLQNILK